LTFIKWCGKIKLWCETYF